MPWWQVGRTSIRDMVCRDRNWRGSTLHFGATSLVFACKCWCGREGVNCWVRHETAPSYDTRDCHQQCYPVPILIAPSRHVIWIRAIWQRLELHRGERPLLYHRKYPMQYWWAPMLSICHCHLINGAQNIKGDGFTLTDLLRIAIMANDWSGETGSIEWRRLWLQSQLFNVVNSFISQCVMLGKVNDIGMSWIICDVREKFNADFDCPIPDFATCEIGGSL